MKVYNLKSYKSGRPVANQFIMEDENKIIFQSYTTEIAWIDRVNKILCVTPDWDYSRTTVKYFYQFLSSQAGLQYNRATAFRKLLKECETIVDSEGKILFYIIKL